MEHAERDTFFRIEHAVITATIALFTLFAIIRADWIFQTYSADDRVCSIVETVEGHRECNIAPLERALQQYENIPWAYFRAQANVRPCADPNDPIHALCLPAPKALQGRLQDPMLASGYATVLFGLWVSLWLGPLFRRMSEQLKREAIIEWAIADEQLIDLWRLRLSYGVAALVGLSVAVGFVTTHFGGLPQGRAHWEFFLSAIVLGALAGHRLGTAAAMGRVGRLAMKRGSRVRLILGHADTMGGARRLGEFLAYQGVLIAIPIAWLSVWIILELSGNAAFREISHWLPLHATLLVIAATISIFSFLRPLLSFSHHYRRAKQAARDTWHTKTRKDLALTQNSEGFDDWEAMHAAIETSAKITSVSEDLAALPSMPLRRSVQGVFSISTLFPLAALAFELVLQDQSGQLAIVNILIQAFSAVF